MNGGISVYETLTKNQADFQGTGGVMLDQRVKFTIRLYFGRSSLGEKEALIFKIKQGTRLQRLGIDNCQNKITYISKQSLNLWVANVTKRKDLMRVRSVEGAIGDDLILPC